MDLRKFSVVCVFVEVEKYCDKFVEFKFFLDDHWSWNAICGSVCLERRSRMSIEA